MNILKEIYISEGSQSVALFYDTAGLKTQYDAAIGKVTRTKLEINGSNHCEMFPKSALLSAGLNDNTFVLRFKDRNEKRPRSLLLTLKEREQVDEVAELLEFCLGLGLKVKQHFCNLSIKEILNSNE